MVAPFMGAWIEIKKNSSKKTVEKPSLPSWERGLKLSIIRFLPSSQSRSLHGSVD